MKPEQEGYCEIAQSSCVIIGIAGQSIKKEMPVTINEDGKFIRCPPEKILFHGIAKESAAKDECFKVVIKAVKL